MLLFDITRLALLSTVIGWAAYQDHKNTVKFTPDPPSKAAQLLGAKTITTEVEAGEVRNLTWIYAPFGLALTVIAIIMDSTLAVPALISMGATTALVIILCYLGGWGGADAKAFLTVAACMPVVSFFQFSPFYMYPLKVVAISAFMALIVGAVKKKQHVRFLPYVFVSLFIALLL